MKGHNYYIFFAMVLSDDTFQLFIVSHVLASGHDLLLCQCDSVHRPASKGSHTVKAADSDSDPTGRPGPTAADC